MKKFIEFGQSPWPMLILTALGTVVVVLTSLDWTYSQQTQEPIDPIPVEATQP